jgi:serine/threonine protein kinase
MVCAFQDRENLYMVLDLMPGGDLRYHLANKKIFTEHETSERSSYNVEFIVACAVVALEYMHTKGVIHRDLKPENMVIDKYGYMRVTDMGIARVLAPNNANDTSGTPGYMGMRGSGSMYVAPEVICRQNHGVAVDYFALGVIAYEFMLGRVHFVSLGRRGRTTERTGETSRSRFCRGRCS